MSTTSPTAPVRVASPRREAPEIVTTLTSRRAVRRLALARDMLEMTGPYAPNEDDRAYWRGEISEALSVLYPDLALSELLSE